MASHCSSPARSAAPTALTMRCWSPRASGQSPPSMARSRRPRRASTFARWFETTWRKSVRASSRRPAFRASRARWSISRRCGSSGAGDARPGPRRPSNAVSSARVRRNGMSAGFEAGGRGLRGRQSPGGHPLLFLHQALTVDAVARERQRVQTPVGDRLPAPFACAEGAIVDLLQRGDDVAKQPTIAVAKLEEELAGVGRVGLVTEVLDGIVLLILPVERGLAHLVRELTLFLEEALLEVRQTLLFHRYLRARRLGALAKGHTLARSARPVQGRGLMRRRRRPAAHHPTGARGRSRRASPPGTRA